MKVLVFGGSFDPIHNGHLNIVNQTIAQLPTVERVFFVPAYQSPGKSPPVASPHTRWEMLEKALVDTPYTSSDVELERQGSSFTIDTLRDFKKKLPTVELFLLLGADAYKGFSQWREPGEIRRLARLVVVGRDGNEPAQQNDRDIILKVSPSPHSSTSLRAALARGEIPPGAFPKYLEQHLKNLLLNGQNPYASLKNDDGRTRIS